MAPGTYQFIETAAPTGYLINETPVKFTIADNANGEPVKVQTQLTDYQGSVVLKKVNDSGQTLEGAAFDLLSEDGTVISNLVTDADGKISASGLAPGNYYFTETAAPVGYKLDSTPIPFTILTTAVDKPELIELEFTNKKLPPQILPPKPVEPEKPNHPRKTDKTSDTNAKTTRSKTRGTNNATKTNTKSRSNAKTSNQTRNQITANRR
ncbi:MSCRAMM family protein [Listeria riparia]|uniref:Outer membrane protein n=1 Tax=Listeria riparia FSL S10-1204 TaxID=1265816 RepID=W7DGL4_9LIST|nr:SpaA isopeptide-forming pilin-related protein [Listeria riparia]EUJ44453.1 outer membrane protein [Listeria riparia FSL S10-1204]